MKLTHSFSLTSLLSLSVACTSNMTPSSFNHDSFRSAALGGGSSQCPPLSLSALLNAWGSSNSCYDLNSDGVVNSLDLAQFLGNYGSSYPTTQSISQHGITYEFQSAVEYCQFANGDFAVKAPVTITRITPDGIEARHGFEVNPSSIIQTAFDSRIPNYNAALQPALPLTLSADSSVVKSISRELATPSLVVPLETAAVLTVLETLPSDGCSNYFRPGYMGSQKTLYRVSEVNTSLLPQLSAVSNMPSIQSLAASTQRVFLDHKGGWTGRYLHPLQNLPDYGASIAVRTNEMILRLMMNDSLEAKRPLLINAIQIGVDLFQMLRQGLTFPADGGHTLGRLAPLAFTAVMLENEEMKNILRSKTTFDFNEGGHTFNLSTNNEPLWGSNCSEGWYWNKMRYGNGARTCADPYRKIDGGGEVSNGVLIGPGDVYQFCCTTQGFKGTALIGNLMPEVKVMMQETLKNDHLFRYSDRWAESGAIAQPDTCAPYDGNPNNYGITYGPHPQGPNPDGSPRCIEDQNPSDGIGRFPNSHGINANGGYYGSAFVNSVWNQYR